jgi:hypothetical protein
VKDNTGLLAFRPSTAEEWSARSRRRRCVASKMSGSLRLCRRRQSLQKSGALIDDVADDGWFDESQGVGRGKEKINLLVTQQSVR